MIIVLVAGPGENDAAENFRETGGLKNIELIVGGQTRGFRALGAFKTLCPSYPGVIELAD